MLDLARWHLLERCTHGAREGIARKRCGELSPMSIFELRLKRAADLTGQPPGGRIGVCRHAISWCACGRICACAPPRPCRLAGSCTSAALSRKPCPGRNRCATYRRAVSAKAGARFSRSLTHVLRRPNPTENRQADQLAAHGNARSAIRSSKNGAETWPDRFQSLLRRVGFNIMPVLAWACEH